jgi:hypothetical protein
MHCSKKKCFSENVQKTIVSNCFPFMFVLTTCKLQYIIPMNNFYIRLTWKQWWQHQSTMDNNRSLLHKLFLICYRAPVCSYAIMIFSPPPKKAPQWQILYSFNNFRINWRLRGKEKMDNIKRSMEENKICFEL